MMKQTHQTPMCLRCLCTCGGLFKIRCGRVLSVLFSGPHLVDLQLDVTKDAMPPELRMFTLLKAQLFVGDVVRLNLVVDI